MRAFLGATVPGVVLARVVAPSGGAVNPDTDKFLLSGVVIDGDFGAIYERKALPLLRQNGDPVGGGFSDEPIDDWFIGGHTMLQVLCPQGDLAAAMHELETGSSAVGTAFATGFSVISLYDDHEILKRTIHQIPCFCNTDSSFFGMDSRFPGYTGDLADVRLFMASLPFGTFHWEQSGVFVGDQPPGAFVAWRVHSHAGSALGAKAKVGSKLKDIYWDARLSHTPKPNPLP